MFSHKPYNEATIQQIKEALTMFNLARWRTTYIEVWLKKCHSCEVHKTLMEWWPLKRRLSRKFSTVFISSSDTRELVSARSIFLSGISALTPKWSFFSKQDFKFQAHSCYKTLKALNSHSMNYSRVLLGKPVSNSLHIKRFCIQILHLSRC